jgi:hypothetical protein
MGSNHGFERKYFIQISSKSNYTQASLPLLSPRLEAGSAQLKLEGLTITILFSQSPTAGTPTLQAIRIPSTSALSFQGSTCERFSSVEVERPKPLLAEIPRSSLLDL